MKIYAGTVMIWPAFGSPPGWMACDGTVLQRSQYPALWNVLSNKYGGDGRTTFALPDLRGRAPIGMGQGPGFDHVMIGQQGNLSTHGSYQKGTLGLNYCIALYGNFPTRS